MAGTKRKIVIDLDDEEEEEEKKAADLNFTKQSEISNRYGSPLEQILFQKTKTLLPLSLVDAIFEDLVPIVLAEITDATRFDDGTANKRLQMMESWAQAPFYSWPWIDYDEPDDSNAVYGRLKRPIRLAIVTHKIKWNAKTMIISEHIQAFVKPRALRDTLDPLEIRSCLKQYEAVEAYDFTLLGVVQPKDWKKLVDDFLSTVEKRKSRFYAIVSLTSNELGDSDVNHHWVCMFIDMHERVYILYDSTGGNPLDEYPGMKTCQSEYARLYKILNLVSPKPWIGTMNHDKIQKSGNECGMYCIWLIVQLIQTDRSKMINLQETILDTYNPINVAIQKSRGNLCILRNRFFIMADQVTVAQARKLIQTRPEKKNKVDASAKNQRLVKNKTKHKRVTVKKVSPFKKKLTVK